jgi:hypothetical protein
LAPWRFLLFQLSLSLREGVLDILQVSTVLIIGFEVGKWAMCPVSDGRDNSLFQKAHPIMETEFHVEGRCQAFQPFRE